MRNGHRARANRHQAEDAPHFAVQPHLTEQRRDDAGGGDEGDGRRTLRRFKRGGDDERHENADPAATQGAAKITADRRFLENRAESAARAGNQQNGRGNRQAVADDGADARGLILATDEGERKKSADEQGVERRAEEVEHLCDRAVAERMRRESGDRAETNEHNRHNNRHERQRGRQRLAITVTDGLRAGIIGRIADQTIRLLMQKAVRPQPARDNRHDSNEQPHANHQTELIAQIQIARGRNRPWRRRHERMRRVQPRRQRDTHRHRRHLHPRRQRLLQRMQNNEAGITKNRNRNHRADNTHRQRRKPRPDKPHHRFRHHQRRPRFLQHQTNNRAEDNHQPNRAENTAEPRTNRFGNPCSRQTITKSRKKTGENQDKKRMPFQPGSGQDNKDDDQQ